MIEAIKDLLFPTRCPYCNRVISKDEYACEDCKRKFPKLPIKDYASGGIECVSPFPYSTIFSSAVKRLKFSNQASYAKQLAVPLAQAIIEVYGASKFDIVTCVPMHKKQQKMRRYNQAELLARECAELLKMPFVMTLEKHRQNVPQHTLKAHEREQNVRGVYRVINKNEVEGKNILIIDDIITTGHTMGECSRLLRKSGATRICGATVCCR